MEKHSLNRYSLIVLFLLLPNLLFAGAPSRTKTYTTGETILPADVTENEDNLFRYLQTGVDTYADGTIVSADITDGTIANADISGSAAITYGKLSLTGGILNADISSSAAITYSKLSLSNSILNADINSSAAIVASKLDLTGITTLTAGGNLDIGSYELRAQTFNSDVTTGTAPMTIASTTKVTNLNADLLDGSSASTTTGSAVIPIADASGYLPNDSVDTTALKTATSEVSATSNMALTLSGGTYSFYPQVHSDGTNVVIAGISGVDGVNGTYTSATYVTNISLHNLAQGHTVYAQSRYVTASGQDIWIFLLIDKTTKEIIAASSAPDHPAYGNGGDFEKLPHPFGSYDETKQEIILLDKEICLAIKQESEQTGKSILTLVNEEYKPNMSKEEVYQPLHSGKFIDKKPELVQTMPDYIKVRKLEKLTQAEKDQKELKRQQTQQKAEQDKQKKAQDRLSAENKLKALGLIQTEIEALKD